MPLPLRPKKLGSLLASTTGTCTCENREGKKEATEKGKQQKKGALRASGLVGPYTTMVYYYYTSVYVYLIYYVSSTTRGGRRKVWRFQLRGR